MHKNFLLKFVGLIFLLAFTCHAKAMPTRWQYFEELEDQSLPSPTEETAVVVFVLPTDGGDIAGAAASAAVNTLSLSWKNVTQIYDATSEDLKFLSQIRRDAKTVIEIPPGSYLFLAANLMSVNVDAGKTYYIFLNAVGGVIAEQYPVRNGGPGQIQFASKEFQSAIENTTLLGVHPASVKYYSKKNWVYKSQVKQRKLMLEDWEELSEEEKQKLTLNAEDGIPAGHSIEDIEANDDSQAAQAKPTEATRSEAPTDPVKLSPSCLNKLRSLEGLKADGIFSEDEFESQKAKLLNQEDC